MSSLLLGRRKLYFLSQYYNLMQYKLCASYFPYTGSAKTAFMECLNNYKSAHTILEMRFLITKAQWA